MDYLRRIIDLELDELFEHLPALAIDGAKGIGKTTTAQQRVDRVFQLDSPAIQQIVRTDPRHVVDGHGSVLIDEWQKVPEVWDVIRRAVDEQLPGGPFLLVGSATPQLGATAHSGAGRIGRLRMRPLTVSERGICTPTVSLAKLLDGEQAPLRGECNLSLADYVENIVTTGLPHLRTLPPRALKFQLDSYLRNVVDRDVADQGIQVRKPDSLLAWLRAYAAATSTTANYSQILDAATPGVGDKPARSTSESYREALTSLWLLDPVPAWQPTGSSLGRLTQSAKHHLADPGFAARLLGLTTGSLLSGAGQSLDPQAGTILGALFESLATLCIRVPAQAADATVGHFRTRNGDHEVDLIVVRDDQRVVAVEVKLAATVTDQDVKHLHWLRDRLGERLLDAIIINSGPAAYRREDGIGVVPLGLLAP